MIRGRIQRAHKPKSASRSGVESWDGSGARWSTSMWAAWSGRWIKVVSKASGSDFYRKYKKWLCSKSEVLRKLLGY